MRRTVVLALALLPALSGPIACAADAATGPDVPLVVGSYCATLAPAIERPTTDQARVTIYRNTLSYAYPRSGGATVQQELRGCRSATCVYDGATAVDDRELVTRCTASTA